MAASWKGIPASSLLYTYDEFERANYRPEPPAPTMAEINALMDRIQKQHKKRFPDPLPEPTPEQVARAMEERFAKTEAQEKLLAKLKDEVLGAYGIQERQVRVTPRTYQQRKQRRKKTTA